VFAIGGPGALSEALAAAVRAAGGEIRCGAEVPRSPARDNRATGVAFASGEEIAAAAVVSGLDPKRTLVDLVDPVDARPDDALAGDELSTPGVVAKVNLVVDRLPRFTAAGGDDAQLLRGRILVAPGIDAMERAFDAAKVRAVLGHADPRGDDPVARGPVAGRGAPDGTHVVSISAQYAPIRAALGRVGRRRAGWTRSPIASSATLDHLAPGSPRASGPARSSAR
jgi:phytoene dehydrogenase-like protein